MNEIHLENICVFVLSGIRQTFEFSFRLDKSTGGKKCFDTETLHYKKISKTVLTNIIFNVERNDERVIFW